MKKYSNMSSIVLKPAAYILFVVGVILSSLAAVPEDINWLHFSLSAVIAAAGALLVRKALAGTRAVKLSGAGSMKPESFFQAALTGIINNISELIYSYNSGMISAGGLKEGIEDLQSANRLIADNRDSIGALYGYMKEADIMSLFSSGERNLARAWSELVDGYPEEALKDLELSREYFSGTRGLFQNSNTVNSVNQGIGGIPDTE